MRADRQSLVGTTMVGSCKPKKNRKKGTEYVLIH